MEVSCDYPDKRRSDKFRIKSTVLPRGGIPYKKWINAITQIELERKIDSYVKKGWECVLQIDEGDSHRAILIN